MATGVALESYIKDLKRTLESEEYQLSFAFIKHIPQDSAEHCELWAEVAYRGWKKRHELAHTGIDFLAVVSKAFTALFEIVADADVHVKQYVRLAHVYASEGSLSGGLEVVVLGSHRGYLTHTGIVLQRWLLLKRLVVNGNRSMELEVDECMSYLVSAISSEEREVDDTTGIVYLEGLHDLPLFIIYLILSSYLHKYIQEKFEEDYGDGSGNVAKKRAKLARSAYGGCSTNVSPTKDSDFSRLLKSTTQIQQHSLSRTFHNKSTGMFSKSVEALRAPLAIEDGPSTESTDLAASASSSALDLVPLDGEGQHSSKASTYLPNAKFQPLPSFGAVPPAPTSADQSSPKKAVDFIIKSKKEALDLFVSFLSEAYNLYHGASNMEFSDTTGLVAFTDTLAGGNTMKSFLSDTGGFSGTQLTHTANPDKTKAKCKNNYHHSSKLTTAQLVKWFRRKQLWLDAGDQLQSNYLNTCCSSFILLAEECYHEAFLRAPLQETGLLSLFDLMRDRKTPDHDMRHFLETQVYPMCPWNLYTRQLLTELQDNDGANAAQWTAVYVDQVAKLIRIQARFRGFRLRYHWRAIAQKAWIVKKEHMAKMKIANEAFKRQMFKIKRKNFVQWRQNAKELKILKQSSALKIQYNLRGHWVRLYYKRQLERVEATNFRYYIGVQNAYNHTRLRILLGWRKHFHFTRNTRCADCLIDTIRSNGFALVMAEAMEKITMVIKVRRRYSNMRVFAYWRELFLKRRKRHAVCTMRFAMRSMFERMHMKEREAYLAELESKAAEFEARMNAPLVANSFKHWHEQWMNFRLNRSKIEIARFLRKRLARRKDRKSIVRRRRVMNAALTISSSKRYKRLYRCFVQNWKFACCSITVQRAIRIFLSKRRVIRRARLLEDVEVNRLKLFRKWTRHRFWRWTRFVYQTWRNRHRGANRLIRYFRLLRTRARMRRLMDRKKRVRSYVKMWCQFYLRRSFIRLRASTIMRHTYLSITRLLNGFVKFTFRCAFNRWKQLAYEQYLLSNALAIVDTYEIDCSQWIGSTKSVRLRRQLEPGSSGGYKSYNYDESLEQQDDPDEITSLYTPNGRHVLITEKFPWETPVASDKVLLSLCTPQPGIRSAPLVMHKLFHAWMSAYRSRRKMKMKMGEVVANKAVNHTLLCMMYRKIFVIKLQCFWRQCLARCLRSFWIRKERRCSESLNFIQHSSRQWYFNRIKRKCAARHHARLVLQRSSRVMVAKRALHHRRTHAQFLARVSAKINTSAFQRVKFRALMRYLVHKFCSDVLFDSRTAPGTAPVFKRKPAEPVAKAVYVNPKRRKKKEMVDFTPPAVPPSLEFAKPVKVNSKLTKKISGATSNPQSGVTLEYQSAAFNSHLFRLRQTGILIMDLRGDDSTKLSKEEAIYAVSNAATLFCPVVDVKLMEVLIRYFIGSKIVLCGGLTVEQNMKIFSEMLHQYLLQRSNSLRLHQPSSESNLSSVAPIELTTVGNGSNTVTAVAPIELTTVGNGSNTVTAVTDPSTKVGTCSVHISDMFMSYKTSSQLAVCLSGNIYSCIRELSIDSTSVGILGISLILMAMKVCYW